MDGSSFSLRREMRERSNEHKMSSKKREGVGWRELLVQLRINYYHDPAQARITDRTAGSTHPGYNLDTFSGYR